MRNLKCIYTSVYEAIKYNLATWTCLGIINEKIAGEQGRPSKSLDG